MARYTLQNESLSVTIDTHGAELRSVKDKITGFEYLWQADSAYWGRTAPVLFPLVGNYKDKTSRYKQKSYTLGQHGFARDSEFSLASSSEAQASFMLGASEKTLLCYPFDFTLCITYTLRERTLQVSWRVQNNGGENMYFSIGAHPAFNCTLSESSLVFDTKNDLVCGVLTKDGLLGERTKTLPLKDGSLSLSAALFAEDALVLENRQAQSASLFCKGKKLVTVEFDAPVLGIWSPAGKDAPFVCIEPWYGRTDKADFSGSLEEREHGNTLLPHAVFEKSYSLELW